MGLMQTAESPSPLAARFLEQALIANFLIHLVAMGSMALLLLPAMPGGGVTDAAARVARIAEHPWLWRLGWLPWQLTAAIDLLLGIALLRTPWIPTRPAMLTTLLTAAAILPDQTGQFLWITRGVGLARQAVQSGDLRPYLAFESRVFPLVAAWGCLFYLLGALGWTYCFAVAGTWNRTLSWLSAATWSVFGLSLVFILLPAHLQPPSFVAAIGNALGFVLLQLWLIGVTELVLRRSRPAEAHGRGTPWRSPHENILGRVAGVIANSRFARALCEWLPMVTLISDITDVVYINYLVDADRLQPYIPRELTLQRLGPGGRYAMFSILTYRHGRFGPRRLQCLRRWFFSPIQSNWRVYVTDPGTGTTGVYFLTTAITSTPYAIAARLLAEGMPMHVPRAATIAHDSAGIKLSLDPGQGTSLDLVATLRPSGGSATLLLPPAWCDCFPGWTDFLAYTVPQDRALSAQPWYRHITRQEIDLQIPLESCEPLEGTVESRAAARIVGDAQPICFLVPRVKFRFYATSRSKTGLPGL